MRQVLLFGANGKMGQLIAKILENDSDMIIIAGVDHSVNKKANYFPVYALPSEINATPDVIIDFSHPSYLNDLLSYVKERHIPVVIGTTGYDSLQLKAIKDAALYAPVLFSANMSFGVNLIKQMLKSYSSLLIDNFDVEIVEKHHKEKQDAPSGTAKLFAETINEEADNAFKL